MDHYFRVYPYYKQNRAVGSGGPEGRRRSPVTCLLRYTLENLNKKLKGQVFLQNSRHWPRLYSFLYVRVGSSIVLRTESSKQ